MPTKDKNTLWVKAEDCAAKFFDADKVRGSGCGEFHKSDARQTVTINGSTVAKEGGYRIEVKSTKNQSRELKDSWFAKIAREAKDTGQIPAFYVMFGDMTSFAIVPFDEGDELKVLTPSPILHIETSTSVTPELLRSCLWPGGYVYIKPDIFNKYNCGQAYIFKHWKIIEDTQF